jgi:hypothetical protein
MLPLCLKTRLGFEKKVGHFAHIFKSGAEINGSKWIMSSMERKIGEKQLHLTKGPQGVNFITIIREASIPVVLHQSY